MCIYARFSLLPRSEIEEVLVVQRAYRALCIAVSALAIKTKAQKSSKQLALRTKHAYAQTYEIYNLYKAYVQSLAQLTLGWACSKPFFSLVLFAYMDC